MQYCNAWTLFSGLVPLRKHDWAQSCFNKLVDGLELVLMLEAHSFFEFKSMYSELRYMTTGLRGKITPTPVGLHTAPVAPPCSPFPSCSGHVASPYSPFPALCATPRHTHPPGVEHHFTHPCLPTQVVSHY